jgi:hypothetical protein
LQETIARLKTYDGLKQQLWGVAFAEGAADPNTQAALLNAKLFVARKEGQEGQEGGEDGEGGEGGDVVGGDTVGRGDGKITSVLALGSGEVRCLGYVRIKSGSRMLEAGDGSVVTAKGEGLPDEGLKGRLCDIPHASRSVSSAGFGVGLGVGGYGLGGSKVLR